MYGQVLESGEIVTNGRYFSPLVSCSRWYLTPKEGGITMITSLRNFIQFDVVVNIFAYLWTYFVNEIYKKGRNIIEKIISVINWRSWFYMRWKKGSVNFLVQYNCKWIVIKIQWRRSWQLIIKNKNNNSV